MAHDDVELRSKFADLGFANRREVHDHGFTRFGVLYSAQHAVLLILRGTLDLTLGGPFFAAFHFHREVDVRGATGIGNRFDGPEIVIAG